MTRHLDERQRSTIVHGLRVAAERFEEDAKTLRAVSADLRVGKTHQPFADGEPGARATDRLAETFERQVRETVEMINLFETSWGVSVEIES